MLKPIPGFSKYAACDAGHIWRIVPKKFGRPTPYKLEPALKRSGYQNVSIDNDAGARKTCRVNRLVALAWHGEPPDPKMNAAHGDRNTLNNRPENLRWCSFFDNIQDKRIHGTIPCRERHPMAKLTEAQVSEIRSRPESAPALAPIYGVSASAIVRARNGRNWRS